jgi:hypothetical protein
MQVKYQPLKARTENECGMIESFLKENPQHKHVDIERLCKIFEVQSNSVSVWPKHLTMIEPIIERWKINQ